MTDIFEKVFELRDPNYNSLSVTRCDFADSTRLIGVSTDRSFLLTPAKARALAEVLVEEANHIEREYAELRDALASDSVPPTSRQRR